MEELSPHAKAVIRRRLEEIERNLQLVRELLEGKAPPNIPVGDAEDISERGERIIFGVFDGQNMESDDEKSYPVPANYASKSKLVEGDKLKLTIATDGSFIYKQVGPVERRRVVGVLANDEKGDYVVNVGEDAYKILLASVTFYKADIGDEIAILLPNDAEATWGTVENVIHSSEDADESS